MGNFPNQSVSQFNLVLLDSLNLSIPLTELPPAVRLFDLVQEHHSSDLFKTRAFEQLQHPFLLPFHIKRIDMTACSNYKQVLVFYQHESIVYPAWSLQFKQQILSLWKYLCSQKLKVFWRPHLLFEKDGHLQYLLRISDFVLTEKTERYSQHELYQLQQFYTNKPLLLPLWTYFKEEKHNCSEHAEESDCISISSMKTKVNTKNINSKSQITVQKKKLGVSRSHRCSFSQIRPRQMDSPN